MFGSFRDLAFLGAAAGGGGGVVIAGFSSFTYGGPFISGGWSIGTAGTTPYGVGIKSGAVDEPIHDASGSIM
jgi:hypothetical protein